MLQGSKRLSEDVVGFNDGGRAGRHLHQGIRYVGRSSNRGWQKRSFNHVHGQGNSETEESVLSLYGAGPETVRVSHLGTDLESVENPLVQAARARNERQGNHNGRLEEENENLSRLVARLPALASSLNGRPSQHLRKL